MNAETLAWIERQKPELVRSAEDYVKEYRIFEAREDARGGPRRPKKPKVSGSQLRNLLNAAQAESSLAVLVNFLRYQIGRGRLGWEDRRSGQGLEELLRAQVGKRIDAAEKKIAMDRYRVEARLAALLLGYLIREFTYRCQLAGTSSHD